MKRICVIDGQGGGIGAAVIRYLKEAFEDTVELTALGTNAIAAFQMLKAGAGRGASDENAICLAVRDADFIVGSVGITWANAMLGEITPKMAEAVVSSPALKVLIPMSQERMEIVGVMKEPLPHFVMAAVKLIKEVMNRV